MAKRSADAAASRPISVQSGPTAIPSDHGSSGPVKNGKAADAASAASIPDHATQSEPIEFTALRGYPTTRGQLRAADLPSGIASG